MKSPLVEALRQASGGSPASESSAPSEATAANSVAGESPDGGNEEQSAFAGELELLGPMETLPIDGSAETDSGQGLYATSSLELVHAEKTTAMVTAAVATVPPPLHPTASSARRRSGMARLGLYSPLLCVALALAATGSYYLYQNLGGSYRNNGLATLSSQTGRTGHDPGAGNADSDKVENRFELSVGRQISLNNTGRENASRTEATSMIAAAAGGQIPKPVRQAGGSGFAEYTFGALGDEALLSVDPGNSAATVALLAGHGDSPSAASESEIKHLIQRHPQSAQLYFALGTLFAEQSRWPDARLAFDKALRLDSSNADYLFNLAVSLEHVGQNSDARRRYESALDAANATSSLNSEVVAARIEKLVSLSDFGELAR